MCRWEAPDLSPWWPAPAHFLTRPGSDFTPSIIISDRSDSGWYDCYNSMQPILISIWDKILDLCTILTNQKQVLALAANQRFPFSISAPSCLHLWVELALLLDDWDEILGQIFFSLIEIQRRVRSITLSTHHKQQRVSSQKFSTCLDSGICYDRGLGLY